MVKINKIYVKKLNELLYSIKQWLNPKLTVPTLGNVIIINGKQFNFTLYFNCNFTAKILGGSVALQGNISHTDLLPTLN